MMTIVEQKKLKKNIKSATVLLSEDPSDENVEEARRLLYEVSQEKRRDGIYRPIRESV